MSKADIPILLLGTLRPTEDKRPGSPQHVGTQSRRLRAVPQSWPADSPVFFSICTSWTKQKSKIKPISSRKGEKQCVLNVCPGPVTFMCCHLGLHTTTLVFWWERPLPKVTQPVFTTHHTLLCRIQGVQCHNFSYAANYVLNEMASYSLSSTSTVPTMMK